MHPRRCRSTCLPDQGARGQTATSVVCLRPAIWPLSHFDDSPRVQPRFSDPLQGSGHKSTSDAVILPAYQTRGHRVRWQRRDAATDVQGEGVHCICTPRPDHVLWELQVDFIPTASTYKPGLSGERSSPGGYVRIL